MEWVACQKIFWGSGLDQMGGPVQTKWVAIYCWVSAWDGMGGLPENILGLGSGPNGWPSPDKMGSHILLGIGLGWNGWPARKYSGAPVWTKWVAQSRQNGKYSGAQISTKWVAIYCWVLAWDRMGGWPENSLGMGSGLDPMGGLVQTKWVAIYCWVSAWDGMGSLPENIMGLGSGPNGWPGPDKMGSHILLGIGLGWNGWPARK
ncbi:hypothetical protein BYT27DRAFT_7208653 [Phlegmacium glaucopus]|nr:hypothetical protein BYT27DRAFT_7208653 [Phlegmacium glaucopus]